MQLEAASTSTRRTAMFQGCISPKLAINTDFHTPPPLSPPKILQGQLQRGNEIWTATFILFELLQCTVHFGVSNKVGASTVNGGAVESVTEQRSGNAGA